MRQIHEVRGWCEIAKRVCKGEEDQCVEVGEHADPWRGRARGVRRFDSPSADLSRRFVLV